MSSGDYTCELCQYVAEDKIDYDYHYNACSRITIRYLCCYYNCRKIGHDKHRFREHVIAHTENTLFHMFLLFEIDDACYHYHKQSVYENLKHNVKNVARQKTVTAYRSNIAMDIHNIVEPPSTLIGLSSDENLFRGLISASIETVEDVRRLRAVLSSWFRAYARQRLLPPQQIKDTITSNYLLLDIAGVQQEVAILRKHLNDNINSQSNSNQLIVQNQSNTSSSTTQITRTPLITSNPSTIGGEITQIVLDSSVGTPPILGTNNAESTAVKAHEETMVQETEEEGLKSGKQKRKLVTKQKVINVKKPRNAKKEKSLSVELAADIVPKKLGRPSKKDKEKRENEDMAKQNQLLNSKLNNSENMDNSLTATTNVNVDNTTKGANSVNDKSLQ